MMCCGSKSKILVYKKDDDLHFEINGPDVSTGEKKPIRLGNVISTTQLRNGV